MTVASWDPAWLRQQPIAHRGRHNGGTIPENSLAACQAAIQANYAIEIDVHGLADGTVAVFHDDDLARMTGHAGQITAQTPADLAPLRLRHSSESIPQLADVLALVDGQVPLVIELKTTSKAQVGRLEAAVAQQLQTYQGAIAIQSFNPYSLAWFRQHAPTIPRGQLASRFPGESISRLTKILLSNLWLNPLSQPHFIGYDLRALPNLPTAIARHGWGLPLIAWTVRTPADYAKARQVADNLIFEHITPV